MSTLQRTLTFLALAGLAIFGCMSSGATRFYTWPWVFYGELLLLAPVALLALDIWRDPAPRLARRTVWALLATAASVGLSTALSLRPLFSLEVALFLWGGLALATLVARRFAAVTPSATPQNLLRTAGLFLALPILSSLVLWLWDIAPYAPHGGPLDFILWLRLQRNLHPAGHWNYTGGLAILALPWLLAMAWSERGRWRTLWLALSGTAIVILFSAASRGATLGTIAAIAVSIFAWAIKRGLRSRTIILLGAAILAAGALLAIANPRVHASLVQGSGRFVPTEGDVQRLGMLQGGVRLFLARPIFGHGTGMTPFVYPSVRTRLVGGVETAFQLHNTPLQWAVDFGIVGFAAAAFLGLVFLNAARQWWLRPASDPLRPYALASTCTIIGYGVLAITDYQLDVVSISAPIAFHLGLLLSGLQPPSSTPVRPAALHVAGLSLIGAATAAAVLLAPNWRARQLFWSAWWTIDAKDDFAIVARLRAAADTAPWNPHYRNHLGLHLAEHATDASSRAAARAELARSLALDPLQEPIHSAMAWLWLPDDATQSERHFRAALALVPDRDTVHLGLAFSLLGQNRTSDGIRALVTECVVNPEFVASPLWQMEPLTTLKSTAAAEADRQFAQILAHQELPAWRQPALRYTRAFVRWWWGGAAPDTGELSGALDVQRQIFAALAPTGTQVALPSPLSQLATVRSKPESAAESLAIPGTVSASARDGALARLAAAPLATLPDLIRRPSPNGRGLTTTKITRGHFAIMQRNNDGPGYADLFPRLRDNFSDTFAGPLYPQRGLVPGPVLHAHDL